MSLHRPPGRRRARVIGVVAAGVTLLTGGALVAVALPASAAGGCRVDYAVNEWGSGFVANMTVTNLGSALTSWTVEWNLSSNQHVTSSWNGKATQNGNHVTLTNEAWNGNFGANTSVYPGLQGTSSGSNPVPTSFTLNGVACNGAVTPTTAATTQTTAVSTPPTTAATTNPTTPATTAATTAATTGPPPSPGVHVTNPYVGAKGYVNPEWQAKANGEPGGSKISSTSTAVWLDRIAAIKGTTNSSSNGSMGLKDHLDAALKQGGGQPITAEFVIYDLPNRDCSALASNGELAIADDGLNKYETQYIDPIAAIMSDPKYASVRIVTIIEPDSLPNLITNLSFPKCQEANSTGGYVKGVQYALDKLHAISNVYTYVDAAHHAWLGWDANFTPVVQLFANVAKGTKAGFASVDGFITNTANTSATKEPYLGDITRTLGGNQVRSSKWVDWNNYADEESYVTALKKALIGAGFSSNLGMLIDTSRNGWGGAARPKGPSTSTDVNTFVNDSRIDRRIHAGNWCNQSGAGLGERPTAAPGGPWAAYVWIKPPAESDGSSTAIPNNEGKGFDRMCDPTYGGNSLNGNNLTGALPGAPISGAWFPAQFAELLKNAYPPVS